METLSSIFFDSITSYNFEPLKESEKRDNLEIGGELEVRGQNGVVIASR